MVKTSGNKVAKITANIPDTSNKIEFISPGTNNTIVKFNGASGNSIQDTGVYIDDNDNITGVNSLTNNSLNISDVTYLGGGVVSFTPVIRDYAGNVPAMTFAEGRYIIMGNACVVSLFAGWSSKASTISNAQVLINLPVNTNANIISIFELGLIQGINPASGDYLSATAPVNSGVALLQICSLANIGSYRVKWSMLNSAGLINITGKYFI